MPMRRMDVHPKSSGSAHQPPYQQVLRALPVPGQDAIFPATGRNRDGSTTSDAFVSYVAEGASNPLSPWCSDNTGKEQPAYVQSTSARDASAGKQREDRLRQLSRPSLRADEL